MRITNLLRQYPTFNELARDFLPQRQLSLCPNVEQCFTANYPSLGLLAATYGSTAPQQWLVFQLADINEYCGSKNKMNEYQLKALASLISTEYHYLKVTELMLFFFRFKGGHYGMFYGSVDPMVITNSLLTFMMQRHEFLTAYEERKESERREASAKNCMSYAEWCKRNGIEPKTYDLRLKTVNDKKEVPKEMLVSIASELVYNPNKISERDLEILTKQFEKRYGKHPSRYLLDAEGEG